MYSLMSLVMLDMIMIKVTKMVDFIRLIILTLTTIKEHSK